MRLSFLGSILLCFALALPRAADAHPHAWISVKTTVILNDKGEAVALREHWLFDRMYSEFAAQDYKHSKNGKLSASDLLPLAKENVSNLKEYSYFTVFETADGKPVKVGEAKDIASAYEAAPKAKQKVIVYAAPKGGLPSNDTPTGSQQIAMDFTVPLEKPTDLKNATYRIYDPTYYVDMTHYEHNPVTFVSEKTGKEISSCQAKVELPKVDQAMVFSAAALDKKATAPKDLGYYFSEKVTLSCSPTK